MQGPWRESFSRESDPPDLPQGPAMSVKIYGSLDDLPPSYQELFGEAGQRDFFQSREWFANLIKTTFTLGDVPRLYALESDRGSPEALLIARCQTPKSRLRTYRSLRG